MSKFSIEIGSNGISKVGCSYLTAAEWNNLTTLDLGILLTIKSTILLALLTVKIIANRKIPINKKDYGVKANKRKKMLILNQQYIGVRVNSRKKMFFLNK